MTTDPEKQSQFELFPQNHQNSQGSRRSPALLKDLTLSQENIIVSCIVFLMISIVFFSFGVERGKRVSSAVGSIDVQPQIVEDGIIVMSDSAKQEIQPAVQTPVIVEEELINVKQEILEAPSVQEENLKDYFTVQVASFKSQESAKKEVEKLKNFQHESFVLPKGTYLIVCVGKFIKKERANAFSKQLKKKYTDCLVRRL